MLTLAQKQVLKADIAANPTLSSKPLTAAGSQEIADFYNAMASPAHWAWRTSVSRADIYHSTSPDATTWDWTTYKNQSQGEQGAWIQMFMGDIANFALLNLRNGVTAIFSGSGAQATQRAHIFAVARRLVNTGEKLFAVGTGSTAAPATMTFEGNLTFSDVQEARELP